MVPSLISTPPLLPQHPPTPPTHTPTSASFLFVLIKLVSASSGEEMVVFLSLSFDNFALLFLDLKS